MLLITTEKVLGTTARQILTHVMQDTPYYLDIFGPSTVSYLKSGNFSKLLCLDKETLKFFIPKVGKIADYKLRQLWSTTYNLPVYYTINPNTVAKEPDFFQELAEGIDYCVTTPATQLQIANPPPYHIIDSVQKLNLMVEDINCLKPNYLVLDLETTGTDYLLDNIRLIGIAAGPYKMYIIPADLMKSLSARNIFKSLLSDLKLNWAGQNVNQFDACFLRRDYGVECNFIFDTMFAHYCVDESRGGHSLDNIAAKYLYVNSWKTIEDYETVDLKTLSNYLALDLHYNYKLVEILNKEIQDEGTECVHDKLLIPASRIFGKMQQTGILVDKLALQQLDVAHKIKILYLKAELKDLIRFDLNPKSPKQVEEFVYNKLKLPRIPGRNASTAMTDEASLSVHKDHPAINLLLRIRRYMSINSLYVEGWMELLSVDSCLHPSFKLHGTDTGRLSCAKPNLQNVPNKDHEWFCDDFNIKNVIVPKQGYSFIEFDFSQLEYRVAAWYSKDPVLLEAFEQDKDVHLYTAALINNIPEEDVTKVQRTAAKRVGFGTIYGLGAESLGLELGISKSSAQQLQNTFMRRLNKFSKWCNEIQNFAVSQGYVQTPTGRKRRFPCIMASNLNAIRRKAVNTPIQSLASDLCLSSIIDLDAQLIPEEARIVLTVHDSILFEVQDDLIDKYFQLIKTIMEDRSQWLEYRVPIKVDGKVGKRYGSMKEYIHGKV